MFQDSNDIDMIFSINMKAAWCWKILDFDNKPDLDSGAALVINYICGFKADFV